MLNLQKSNSNTEQIDNDSFILSDLTSYCHTFMQKTFVLLLLIIVSLNIYADFPEEQPSSRAASIGYSGAALTDGWSLFHNQAGLGYQDSYWAGVHHENRFISPELSFSALGAFVPFKSSALGFSIKRLGFSQFSQTKFGLAYGMKLAPTLSAGVQLNMHHVYIAGEYGSSSAFSAEGGIIYSPTESLFIGLHVVNPTRSRFYDEERIPTLFNLGIAYQLSEKVLITTGAEKNLDKDFAFKGGIEFVPIQRLSFRTGFSSNPSILSFGLGYQIASLQIDLAFTRHEILGYTPHFSLSYVFGKKNLSSTDSN